MTFGTLDRLDLFAVPILVGLSIAGCSPPNARQANTESKTAEAPSIVPAAAEPLAAVDDDTVAAEAAEPTETTAAETVESHLPDTQSLDTRLVEPDESAVIKSVTPAVNDPERGGPPPARLLLPTTSGVLIIDVDIRIGTTPLNEVFAARIDAVITEARQDAADELTWPQLFDHVRADPLQFGSLQGANAGQDRDRVRRYDTNRNKIPDHDEVAKFLFRNSRFAGSFRLRGTDHYRHVNRSRSTLFKTMDASGDGFLDSGELSDATHALLLLDQNSDRSIRWSEVVLDTSQSDQAWNQRRSNRRGGVAMDTAGYVDWAMISYSFDADLQNSPFGIENHPIDALDQDHDGSISGEEAKALGVIPADLKLLVQFPERVPGNPTLRIVSMRRELKRLVTTDDSSDGSSDSISLRGERLNLVIRVIDAKVATLSDSDQEEPIWKVQVRGRAAEFPDGVFAWLDQNQDQILSERELQSSAQRLPRPGGRPIGAADIPDSYLVQISRGDPAQDAQTFALSNSANRDRQSLPRWAVHMDANRDGDISQTEFIGTQQQFNDLDTNSDGFLDAQETN